MKPGDKIHVRACKADGTVYRSWHTMIESVNADSIVTISPAGGMVQDRARKSYTIEHILRSYYWFDKFIKLLKPPSSAAFFKLFLRRGWRTEQI